MTKQLVKENQNKNASFTSLVVVVVDCEGKVHLFFSFELYLPLDVLETNVWLYETSHGCPLNLVSDSIRSWLISFVAADVA